MMLLNKDFSLRDLGYSNTQYSIDSPRHRWYFFKEAFGPQIVEKAIEDANCSQNDLIIDPFSGSGTVPLVASLNGYQGIGFEVNPFLAFMSNTKLLQVEPTTLETNRKIVFDKARQGKISSLETFSTFSEAGGAKKWLFNRDVLRSFEGGWEATANMNTPVRDLLRLGLLGAAMDNCNAFKDGKCLRYLKDWQSRQFGPDDFLTSFERRIETMKSDLENCPNHNRGQIFQGDSRNVLNRKISDKFKLCITSPPYLNSFDYTDVYRPELFLGKFVRTQEQLRLLRHHTIRSHVQANWKKPNKNTFGPLYKESIEKVISRIEDLWDKRIPLMIQAYFEDIDQVLRKLRSSAKPDATLWFIVSTSAYTGVEIPVDLIIAHIGSKTGWFLREVGVLRYLRSSGQHWRERFGSEEEKPRLRESVIIFDASPAKFRQLQF